MFVRGIGDASTTTTLNLPWAAAAVSQPSQIDADYAAVLAAAGGGDYGVPALTPQGTDVFSQVSAWISANPVPVAIGSAAAFLLAFAGGNARR